MKEKLAVDLKDRGYLNFREGYSSPTNLTQVAKTSETKNWKQAVCSLGHNSHASMVCVRGRLGGPGLNSLLAYRQQAVERFYRSSVSWHRNSSVSI